MLGNSRPRADGELRRARPLLGTLVEIRIPEASEAANAALESAFSAIGRVHALMSFHEPTSDLGRINRAAAGVAVDVDPWTFEVLVHARRIAELSDGLFDVTVADVLVLRGLLPALPGAMPAESSDAAQRPSFRELELRAPNRVAWRRKSLVDLGGIAKGYAVDRALQSLREAGIASAVVNAGGDLACFGRPAPVHLRDPMSPRRLVDLGDIDEAAVATSAGYFSETRDVDALVDPRRAACTSWRGSVSVIARDCVVADALTKVVALDPDRAPRILSRLGAQALRIDATGLSVIGDHAGFRLRTG